MSVVKRMARPLVAVVAASLFALSPSGGHLAAQSGVPGAPVVDSVTAGDGALHVAWTAPSDTGSTTITAYDLRHIETSASDKTDANWTVVSDVWAVVGPLSGALVHVDNGVQYDVQVRAVNSRGDGAWSSTATGTPADHADSRGSATTIALQTPTPGRISSGSDEDYFRFTLSEATGIFIYTTSYLSGFLPTTGELQNSSGSLIKSDDDDAGIRRHGDQLFLWDSLAAGTYYVKVEAPESGAYTLHTQLAPDGSTLEDAVDINLGESIGGILDTSSDDEDFYRLELAQSADVFINIARANAGLDPLGTLLDEEGNVLEVHDDSFLEGDRKRHFLFRRQLDAGVYFLKVDPAPEATYDVCRGFVPQYQRRSFVNCGDTESKSAATTGGPYFVSVVEAPSPGSSFSSAREMPVDGNVLTAGRIDRGSDSDYFSITVNRPTHVAVQVVSNEVETSGTIYNSSRRQAATFASETDYVPGGYGFILYAQLSMGTSYVRVSADDSSETGGYTIRAVEDRPYADFLDTCSSISTSYDDPLYGCQWYLNNTGQNSGIASGTSGEDINVEDVWDGGNLGEGIYVAMVDDGLEPAHEDLHENLDASKNFDYDYRGDTYEPHFNWGTQLAGLVAGRDNSTGIRGVAPRATLFNLNAIRYPSSYRVADAMTRHASSTAVSNNGWTHISGPGFNHSSGTWELAVEEGLADGFNGKGTLYTVPSGNGAALGDYSNLSGYANYYGVTAVCAVNDLGQRAAPSEKGSNLWLCAPSADDAGNRQGVTTTMPYDRYSVVAGGTAGATALVSGVAALVRKANPNLTWRDVKLVLAASARKNHTADADWASGALKYGSTTDRYNFNHSYGFGVVDAKAAVDLAGTWTNLPRLKSLRAESARNLGVTIADDATVSRQVTVGPGIDFIEYVDVTVDLLHPSFRDLKVELVSPSNAVSALSASYDGDDKYALEGRFRLGTAKHLGENAAGTWTLRFIDEVTGNSGTLNSWNLKIYGHGSSVQSTGVTTVISKSASLEVVWSGIDDPDLAAYDVRHIRSDATDKADANWTATEDVRTGSGPFSYEISGLTNDVSYDVQVRGAEATVDGLWSSTVTGTPTADADAVPRLTGVLSEEDALGLAWSAPASPDATVTAYDVRHIRSDASDKADANWMVVDDAWTEGPLVYVITGLSNGVLYDVQVRSVTSNGDGTWSATAKGQPHEVGEVRRTASPLAFDVAVHAALDYSSDIDVFRIDLSEETEVLLSTTGSTDTIGELLDADGKFVKFNDDGGIGLNFALQSTLAAGSYFLQVSGYFGDTGPYVLKMRTPEEVQDVSDTLTLTLGGSIEAIITRNDVDYYELVLTEETEVLLYSSGSTDTVGELLDDNEASLVTNDDAYLPTGIRNFLIRRTLAAGTYRLKVTGYFSTVGAYTVHAKAVTAPGNTSTGALSLTFGSPEGGNIDPAADADYYTFTLAEVKSLNIKAVRNPHANSPPELEAELFDSSLNALDTYFVDNYYSESFEINDHLDAGTYYLKVTAESDTDTAAYILMASETDANRELNELCSGLATDVSDPFYGCQWYLESDGQLPDLSDSDINIGDVWDDYKGDGITVAIVDSGLDYRHADLRGDRVDTAKNHSYLEGRDVDARNPSHGTGVAGIIAGRENNIGIRGIAPEATIYAYNYLTDSTDENEADALSRESATTAVYNNSWGAPDIFAGPQPASSLFKMAIEDGVTNGYGGKGSFYVWAAGNGHTNGDYSTLEEYSNHYGVTAVCAVNSHGKRATYSELGANLWVCGSSNGGGRGVLTTTFPNTFTPNFGGTSAASPMVAGVAALLRDANADLTWRDIKLILAASAQKVDPDNTGWEQGALKYSSTSARYDFNHEFGFGLVDARAAVTLAENWTTLPKFRRLTSSSGSLELAIPDAPLVGPPTVITSTLTVEPYVDFVEYVEIEVHVAHGSFRDLQIELVSPSGAVSVLSPPYSSEESGSFSFLFFLFLLLFGLPDASWDEPIDFGSAKHLGENGAGEWTLRISDHYSEGTGGLKSWSITVYGHGDSPEIPEIDTITPGVRSAAIAWTAPADPNSVITGYDLRHADASATDLTPDDWTLVESIWTSGALSYTLTGLDAVIEHVVQIRAVSSLGPGPWSPEEKVQPTLAVPTAASVDEVRSGDRSLAVFWQPPSEALGDEITSYDVRYILTSADETVESNWTSGGAWRSGPLRIILASLTNDSEHDVQVRAVNSAGNGAWSATSTGTPADRVNVSLSWERSAVPVVEDVGPVTLKATLVTTEAGDVPSSFSVDVGIEVSGSATIPVDFTLDATTLTFNSSDFTAVTINGDDRHRAQKDVVATIRDDGRIESPENFTLKLVYQGLVMSHLVGNNASVTVTISDNDHVPVSLSWDKSSIAVDEGSGRIVLNAIAETTMNRAPNDDFALQALVSAAPGSATTGDDYAAALQRVVFPKSAFTRTTSNGLRRYRATVRVEFSITDDTMDEPDEDLTLFLSHANPSLRHAVGDVARASVVIRDNDFGPVSLDLEHASSTVAEDGTSVTFTAHVTTETELMPEHGFSIDVTVSTAGISAVQGTDYRGLTNTTRFRQSDFSSQMVNGEPRYRASKDYTVTILDDSRDEPDEEFRFTLSFSDPSLPHQVGGSQEAIITITDNDHVPVTLGWEQIEFTAEEPTSPSDTTSVTLTATAATSVDKRPESGFTFDYTVNTRNGTAQQPADYRQLSTTGTFDRNDFSRTLVDGHYRYVASTTYTVEVAHDTADEPNETFTVRLAFDGASQTYLLLGDATATVTVTDDIASLTDLRTTVSASLGTVSRANQLTYEWSIDNSGPSASTATRLVATLDAGASFVSATPAGQCRNSGNSVTCSLGTVEVNESASGDIVVEIKETASADVDFSARAYSDQLDRTPGDNTSSEHTELFAPPKAVTGLKASPSSTYIDLSWTKPGDNGSAITGYRLERKVDDGTFEPVFPQPDSAAASYRNSDVELDKEYTYRILAINSDGDSEWSVEISAEPRAPPPPVITGGTGGGGGGGFGPAPVAPRFAEGFRTTRSVPVKAKDGDAVGDPILAAHQDDLEITYSLSGADAALFSVDERTGQIRVREGVTLDRGVGQSYTVNLTATDSAGFGAIIVIVVEVAEASHHRYDANRNGVIDRDEVIAAVRDYFAGLIEKDDVIEIIKLYFAS